MLRARLHEGHAACVLHQPALTSALDVQRRAQTQVIRVGATPNSRITFPASQSLTSTVTVKGVWLTGAAAS